ncbi:hypothetical protein GYMLUDRAFT_61873 [Collybiopsis luxurians FD-317 M1]|uniref:Uncharacterized protein n=1 Tax=Collybiopsis luxurians FD-317 M1 TaxID=944289 RepID=A0A0D0BNP6_9AGAR|nr:hypothetical protein GYMLUDRAFT_61873 [Collybiopsis luxurians FD-317 M1]
MRWFAPPTRREITLLLFCATVFTFAYNLEHSLRYIGYDSSAVQTVSISRSGYSSNIQGDGRKSSGLRDQLDDLIIGNFDWNEEQVLNANLDRGQALGVGRHDAMWVGKNEQERLWPPTNEPGVSAGFWRWNEDVPTTSLVEHVPGYTIMDQVIILNNVVYIVTDEPQSFPDVNSITVEKWQIIPSEDARTIIGRYGGIIHGVSWMCTEPVPQNTTLLSLWSMHSSLEPSTASPARLILPQTSAFEDSDLDENYDKKKNLALRLRSATGSHPFLTKIAFPHMGITYKEDWEDYMGMEVPYVIQRLVIADYRVAGTDGLSTVLQRAAHASRNWWEPIRHNVAEFFQEFDDQLERNSITYVHRPGAMNVKDHDSLVRALNRLGEDRDIDIHLVEALDGDRENNVDWGGRMAAVVKSNVILSVQGPDILDGVFLKPSPVTTMVEFFSPDVASREHESIARALGSKYIAWSNNRFVFSLPANDPVFVLQLSLDEISRLPNVQGDLQGYGVPVDANAVVEAILDTLKR